MLGRVLTKMLIDKGYQAVHLGRTPKENPGVETHVWDIKKKKLPVEAVTNLEAIIHLAGAGIADKRWSASRKKEIIDSRVESAHLIYELLSHVSTPPKVFISASAVGYYGAITSEHVFTETDTPANDFLGHTCQLWEQAADRFKNLGMRVVKLRIGVVLSPTGGALEKMTAPIKAGFGSPLGSGKQYVPWIHISDLARLFLQALENDLMHDTYNAVAPAGTTNKELTKALARRLNKKIWLPNVPEFVLNLLLGEMAVIVTKGSRVSAIKTLDTGFNFQFPNLDEALGDLF